jgi:hypothetical protein
VRLFTDFRYAEAARAVDGVRFEETKRSLLGISRARLSGPTASSGLRLVFRWETLGSGSVEPCRGAGSSSAARREGRGELAAIRQACEITDRMFERLPRSASSAGRA